MEAPEPFWRVGRSQPTNLYRDGVYVGVIFASPELAAEVASVMNHRDAQRAWMARNTPKEAE